MTLGQIDTEAAKVIASLGAKSCFLHYRNGGLPPFPSHACLSLNHCVVHGTAGYHTAPLREGDLLKIDIGVLYQGWVGDAAWTYSLGKPSEQIGRLMESGKQSLRRGIAKLRPGGMWVDWARAVQTCVEQEFGFKCVRGLGGHGIGKNKLHGPPFVSNVVPAFDAEWPEAFKRIEPGVVVAVEPMIAVGTSATTSKPKAWPIFSADGSAAVHYEADILITENGPRDLTEGMFDLPDVVG